MNKIPFPKKLHAFKGDKILRYLKYVVLIGLVAGSAFGYLNVEMGGEMSGERITNAPNVIGLVVFVLLCVVTSRPFCKYLCPVGGVLGLFNLLPFGKYKVSQSKCVGCGACAKVCKIDIDPVKTPNAPECIRCGNCKKKCPTKAITSELKR
jgi:polyferredoxin